MTANNIYNNNNNINIRNSYSTSATTSTCAIIVAMRSMTANNKPLGGVFQALGKMFRF